MQSPIRVTPASALILAASLSSGCLETPDGSLVMPATDRGKALVDRMLAGDIANAFTRFRDSLSSGSTEAAANAITNEQRIAIEALQAQLDDGTLTQDEFVAKALEIIGEAQSLRAFAGSELLGTPFEVHKLGLAAEALGLTPAQQRRALAIYRALHGDIGTARELVRGEILATLSTQQAALLTRLANELFDQLGIPEAQRPIAKLVFDAISSRLDLSALQRSQIDALRSALGETVASLHASAREQFLALLTDAQRELLSILENAGPTAGQDESDTIVDVISDLIAN